VAAFVAPHKTAQQRLKTLADGSLHVEESRKFRAWVSVIDSNGMGITRTSEYQRHFHTSREALDYAEEALERIAAAVRLGWRP
jgi:hypothetical protein